MSSSFNYISLWDVDKIDERRDTVEMSRGRMFEYTSKDIADRLSSLNSASLEFIEKLPTFVCSEINLRRSPAVMSVKFGKISNIKVNSREVSANFETQIDFGDVVFSSVDEAKEVFGADNLQLFRTHWAVRDGDVNSVLVKLQSFTPSLASVVARLVAISKNIGRPPNVVKRTIGSAENVEQFLQLLYGISTVRGTETFFRGHENETFELTPSLLRKWPNGEWRFMHNEDKLCRELLIAHHDEFQNDQYCFDRLVRMQHYGLPTRLLDISGNPLVALFFACQSKPLNAYISGEVIVFQIDENKIKYYDSDTVSCISNLSKLNFDQKNKILSYLSLKDFNETETIKALLHYVRSEKGFFESRINPDDISSVICVKAKKANERIKSQSGSFLLFGQDASLLDSGNDYIRISRIRITNKLGILEQLNRININDTTVYPSIDRTAASLTMRYMSPESSD